MCTAFDDGYVLFIERIKMIIINSISFDSSLSPDPAIKHLRKIIIEVIQYFVFFGK